MAHLLTGHDKFHLHAALGLTALLHFFARFWILLFRGRDSFTADLTSAAMLGVHFLLHATSFQFHLPEKRMVKPMIWREYRFHNAIFAYRNLIGAAIGVWMPEFWYRGETMSVFGLSCKVCLVLLTCFAADVATERLGNREERTTKSMLYPSGTPKNVEATIKLLYAKAQFVATALSVFGTPMLAFGSVFAIEIASFLMTLRRKGKIEVWLGHTIYAASLLIMLPALLATLFSGDKEAEFAIFRAQCVIFVAVEMRLYYKQSKYLTWVVAIVSGTIGASCIAAVINFKIMSCIGGTWGVVDILAQLHTARSRYNAQTCTSIPLQDGTLDRDAAEPKGKDERDNDVSEDTTADSLSSHESRDSQDD